MAIIAVQEKRAAPRVEAGRHAITFREFPVSSSLEAGKAANERRGDLRRNLGGRGMAILHCAGHEALDDRRDGRRHIRAKMTKRCWRIETVAQQFLGRTPPEIGHLSGEQRIEGASKAIQIASDLDASETCVPIRAP